MAGILIQSKVRDFAAWKKVFDSGADFRASFGGLSEQVYHDAGDPNQVVILLKWKSLAEAQKFTQSPELKEMMNKSGVEGPPVFHFLNEA